MFQKQKVIPACRYLEKTELDASQSRNRLSDENVTANPPSQLPHYQRSYRSFYQRHLPAHLPVYASMYCHSSYDVGILPADLRIVIELVIAGGLYS